MGEKSTRPRDVLLVHDLTLRVEEAQEALSAIREGQVDALVVQVGEHQEVLLLKGAEKAYQVLFETLNEGAMTVTGDGTILYANHRFAELVDHPLEELLGAPLQRFVAPKDTGQVAELLAQATQGSSKGELCLVKASGALVPVMASLRVVGEAPESTYTLVVTDLSPIKEAQAALQEAHDKLASAITALREEITTRARLETELRSKADQLVQAHQRKDEFLAMLAHELRNPLAPILDASELLRIELQGQPTLEQRCHVIQRQTRHLARLIDDLLDVSRITRGAIKLRKSLVDLNELARVSMESVASLMSSCGHRVSVTLPEYPMWLHADPARIEQILVNLLTNAAKYTKPGGQITLSVERKGQRAGIRVRDNGIGIPADLLPHVFELFVQGERALDRSQGGLGIGLTLVKRLVDMHGGHVEAHSPGIDQGSEFVIDLPLAPPAEIATEKPVPAPIPAPAPSAPPCRRRILVVEDNVDAAEMLAALLERWGYEVRIAFDGPQALRLAEGFVPDAVLLDIGLPGMDGFEVARKLRRSPIWAGEGATPVTPLLVMVSGYSHERARRAGRDCGFDCFLTKPPDPDALRRILEQGGSAADRL
jgi:PAS domain S-box-containing protein